MARQRRIFVAFLVLACIGGLTAQSGPDRDTTWNAFIAWWKTVPVFASPFEYAAKLKLDGKTEAEVSADLALITNLLGERSDWIAIFFDKVFARPLTGDPAKDGFSVQSSALLVDSIKGLKPGTALDAGVGQGRNAVYLAQQGWVVTGFDISGEALAVTTADAEKAGVHVTTVKASYDTFDYGSDRWDLIVLAFAWAPVTDPAFVARLRTSLRPGGRVVFEHFVHASDRPRPNFIRPLKPDQLRSCFSEFELAFCEETEGLGAWGGPGSRLARMVAVKR